MSFELGKYRIHLNFNIDKFPALNPRPLFAGFIVAFIMTIVSQLGFQLPEYRLTKLLSPVDVNVINVIKNKLQNNSRHDYKLFKNTPLIGRSFAAANFENASSYIVVDFDSGKVITEKDSNVKLPIASLTKIMTAIVALDLANPSDLFNVSYNASRQVPTKIGIESGEKLTVEELLNAVLLTSANDAAGVIKDEIDKNYGKGSFIQAMNTKAELLGLKNTHFSNPQGFDSKYNYSTAEDLAMLSHFAITKYPLVAEIVKKDYEYIPENKYHGFFDLYNWNGLVGVYPNTMGIKIGNTDNAGYTAIVLSERGGKKMLVTVLGAPALTERDLWASELLDYSFEKTLGLPPVAVNSNQLIEKYNTWRYYN